MILNFNEESARDFYRFLNHDNFTEIRVLDPKNGFNMIALNYVDDEDEFIKTCKEYNGNFNIYTGIHGRQIIPYKKDIIVCSDATNIDYVQTIMIDIDPDRDKRYPASDIELKRCYKASYQVCDYFEKIGLKKPMVCMSGNGIQIFFAIPKIAITDYNRESIPMRIKKFTEFIKRLVTVKYVSIDNTYDLPRLCKVIGTQSIKGKYRWGRPYRVSRIETSNNKNYGESIRDPDEKLLEEIYAFEIPEVNNLNVSSRKKNSKANINYDLNISINGLKKCRFYQFYKESPELVTQKMWYNMISHMARCGKAGEKMGIELTRWRERNRNTTRYRTEKEILWRIRRIRNKGYGATPCNKMEWNCEIYPCIKDGTECNPIKLIGKKKSYNS